MPKALHNKLKKSATKKGLKRDAKNTYIYGTMQKIDTNKKRKYKGDKLAGRM